MILQASILGFTTIQRLGELVISRRNTKALTAKGGREVPNGHYPFLIALHSIWLIGLWVLALDKPVVWPWLAVYFLGQAMRLWVILTLGERWTTKIVVLPGAPLVRTGPYRFLAHPNYIAVAVEVAALPLAFGLCIYAAVFSILNAVMLLVRIRAEDAALAEASRLM